MKLLFGQCILPLYYLALHGGIEQQCCFCSVLCIVIETPYSNVIQAIVWKRYFSNVCHCYLGIILYSADSQVMYSMVSCILHDTIQGNVECKAGPGKFYGQHISAIEFTAHQTPTGTLSIFPGIAEYIRKFPTLDEVQHNQLSIVQYKERYISRHILFMNQNIIE